MGNLPNCADCGRFCIPAARQTVYTNWPPQADNELVRCAKCLAKQSVPNPRADPFAARCADLARRGCPDFDPKDYE